MQDPEEFGKIFAMMEKFDNPSRLTPRDTNCEIMEPDRTEKSGAMKSFKKVHFEIWYVLEAERQETSPMIGRLDRYGLRREKNHYGVPANLPVNPD